MSCRDLTALESLDDQALWRVMLETVPLDQQQWYKQGGPRDGHGALS